MIAKRRLDIEAPFRHLLQPAPHQVQVMTPAVDIAQVREVRACVALADHPFGFVVAVAVTVTFCEGVKPCAEPSPEKYLPPLSAAKLSSWVARLRRSDFIAAT